MTEEQATDIVWEAIASIGGTRSIYRNPRQAYSAQSRRLVDVGNHTVEIRYGEISTPAVASIQGWVFEIHDEDIEVLLRPRAPHSTDTVAKPSPGAARRAPRRPDVGCLQGNPGESRAEIQKYQTTKIARNDVGLFLREFMRERCWSRRKSAGPAAGCDAACMGERRKSRD